MNTKLKLFLFIIIINLSPFLLLFTNIEGIRLLNDINQEIVFPIIVKGGFTNSPDFINLWYYIFQFDFIIFLLYFVLLISSFFVITSKRNKTHKGLFLIVLEVIFITLSLFKPQYLIPLVLLYHFSVVLIIVAKNYIEKKPIKNSLILLTMINICGIIVHYIYRFNTLGSQTAYELLYKDFTLDLNYIQSISSYLIMDNLTSIYIDLFVIGIIITILWLIFKTLKNVSKRYKDDFLRIIKFSFIIFIFILLIVRISSFSFFSFESFEDKRTITPITGCYLQMNIGLGESYLKENKYYFERCFETTDGVFTVYKEVKQTGDSNPFDLVKDDEYTRTFIVNEQGEEILSIALDEAKVNIYATTLIEHEQGENNLILVETHNKEQSTFSYYSFYDFSGELVLELPYGLPDWEYLKKDLLDINSFRLFFKENKIIYTEIIDGKPGNKYYYYIDGTKELITE